MGGNRPGFSLGELGAFCSISQIQLRIDQLLEVLRLISSGAIHRVRRRPPFVTLFAK